MTSKTNQNIGASIRQRLLNKARQDKRPFSELLQYFTMERFLFRLSQSPYIDNFVLKGALLLRAWELSSFRPTMDIDMLGQGKSNEFDTVLDQIRNICSTTVEPEDSLIFNAENITGQRVTEDADYEGIRVSFIGKLDTARINMQLDIGFGDIVVPATQRISLPSMLDFPPPNLNGYSMESVIAEKFEAMLKLGELNSRMKDFYDIWMLTRQFTFDHEQLCLAISKTLQRRDTVLSNKYRHSLIILCKANLNNGMSSEKDWNWKTYQTIFLILFRSLKVSLNRL